MRHYPKALHKENEKGSLRVYNEQEEYEAGLKGYERHRNPEVNKREKGTDKEILRVNPELEKKRLEDEKKAQYSAELIEVAKKALKDEKKASKVTKITDVVPEIKKKKGK
jgi:hypothetical protein